MAEQSKEGGRAKSWRRRWRCWRRRSRIRSNSNSNAKQQSRKIEHEDRKKKNRRAKEKDTIAPTPPLVPLLPPFLFPLLIPLLFLLRLLLSVCHALPPINIDWKSIGLSSLSLSSSLSPVLMSFTACMEALRAAPFPLPHSPTQNICKYLFTCMCTAVHTYTRTHRQCAQWDRHACACVRVACVDKLGLIT